MKVAIHYFSKVFRCEAGEPAKQCYLRVCRWIAEHLIGVNDLDDTYWKVHKINEHGVTHFKLDLYAMIDENQSRESFCNACKDFHKRFYVNQQFNCERCNMNARLHDLHTKLKIKKEYRKERLQYVLKKKQNQ